MTNRRDHLFLSATQALDANRDILNPQWLRAMQISESEREVLTSQMAAVLLGYLAAEKELQVAIHDAYSSPKMMEVCYGKAN